MNKVIALAAMMLVGLGVWRIGGSLSPDTVAMAVGVLFGILAGIPTALLMLASNNRRVDANPQRAQLHPQQRYQVIAGTNGAQVLDTQTGATYVIEQPRYQVVQHD